VVVEGRVVWLSSCSCSRAFIEELLRAGVDVQLF